MIRNNNPICLFDSGIGGFTVLKKLLSKFPYENYIYFADLAHVPFGDKTKDEIKIIVGEILEWFLNFNPKLVVMACNTSSTVFSSQLPALSSQFNVPLFGTIESCAKEIANSNYSQVTVWATKLVVENSGYKNAIQRLNPDLKVEEISCPKIVPMIEDLNFTIKDRNNIINEYYKQTSKASDALILGCTHYPLITEDIKNLTNLKIIDPACSLISDLGEHLQSSLDDLPKSTTTIYTTAQIEKVERFTRLYLGIDLKVNMISLKKVLV